MSLSNAPRSLGDLVGGWEDVMEGGWEDVTEGGWDVGGGGWVEPCEDVPVVGCGACVMG